MDTNKLTTRSQEAIADAVRRASNEGHPRTEPVHLLLALLAQQDGTAAPLLDRTTLQSVTAAGRVAGKLNDEYISTEHLLVGLAEEGGEIAALLRRNGATPDALLAAFEQIRGSARVTSPDPEGTYKALEKYGVDLTARARAGELDPI